MTAECLPIDISPVDEDAKTIYSKGSALDIKAPARELLERYSNMPPEKVDAHVFNLFPEHHRLLWKDR